MRNNEILAAMALVVLTGCGMAPTTPSDTFRSQQIGGSPGYGHGQQGYGPQLALVATGPAQYITPRGALTNLPGRRNDVDIIGLDVQGNQIRLLTRDGRTLFGYTHRHGPDLGFAAAMPDGDNLEGIVHTSTGAYQVTFAYVTTHGRVFSGRQDFAPAPQTYVQQTVVPGPQPYARPY